MIVLNRNLKIKSDRGDTVVPIKVYLPVDEKDCWSCEYEIGWPTTVRKRRAFGIDGIQAVLLALQNIGIELYTSDAHRSGQLVWLEQGNGRVPTFPQCQGPLRGR